MLAVGFTFTNGECTTFWSSCVFFTILFLVRGWSCRARDQFRPLLVDGASKQADCSLKGGSFSSLCNSSASSTSSSASSSNLQYCLGVVRAFLVMEWNKGVQGMELNMLFQERRIHNQHGGQFFCSFGLDQEMAMTWPSNWSPELIPGVFCTIFRA